MAWYLYILECRDGSLYTGIALDVDKRFEQHRAGKGARYTRSRPPKQVLYRRKFRTRSAALKAEYRTKRLSRSEKWALCGKKRGRA